jgi:hypothetical protein
MSNPLLDDEPFTQWLNNIQTIVDSAAPGMHLVASATWKRNGSSIGGTPGVAFPYKLKSCPSKLTIDSDEWIRVSLKSTNRITLGWCWVCSKDDPTDPFGRIKEGAIIAPYSFRTTSLPNSNNVCKGSVFYFCGNIFDEFGGLGFLDPRDGTWMKQKERKKNQAAYLLNKTLIDKAKK